MLAVGENRIGIEDYRSWIHLVQVRAYVLCVNILYKQYNKIARAALFVW